MDETPNGEQKPHGAVKIYDRPATTSKLSPAVLGVALTVVLLIIIYELYRHFAH